MVAPAVRRVAAAQVMQDHGLSERRACSLLGADREMVGYRLRRPDDAALRARPRELSGERRARVAIKAWASGFNQTRPHSVIGYQAPATYAATFPATDDRPRIPDQLRRSSAAPPSHLRKYDQRTQARVG